MKKVLLLIAILSVGFIAHAEQDTTRNALKLIAEELNISEQHAFDTLVQQQRVIAWRNILTIITMLFALFNLFKYVKKAYNIDNMVSHTNHYGEYKIIDNKYVFYIVLSAVVFCVGFGYNIVTLEETFTGLLNPEYGALEQLNFLSK